jgi:hypothetical protein
MHRDTWRQAAVIRHFAAHPVGNEEEVEQVPVSPSLTVHQQLELAAADSEPQKAHKQHGCAQLRAVI